MKKVIFFALMLILPACGHVDPSVTDQTVYYRDAPVRKSALQVSVRPKERQYRPLTAYSPPFVIQQQNADYRHLANAFGQIFQNVWMEERLFPILEFEHDAPYRGKARAMRIAQFKGADLLIIGKIPYFYAGHTLDDTAVTIQIDIYSVPTGLLLWTMMQSARIEEKAPKDFIYYRLETRLSTSPLSEVIRAIAKDMAIPLAAWLPDPDADYAFAESTREIRARLAPSGTRPPSDAAKSFEAELAPEAAAMADAIGSGDGQENGRDQNERDDGMTDAVRPSVKGVNLDVRFDFDKATIRPVSFAVLDALGEAMNSPELKGRRIIVAGHTDAVGDTAYNVELSKRRANSVKTYLVNKWGLAPEQIETVGYGESRPLNDGTTPEERQRNRRVEIRLAE